MSYQNVYSGDAEWGPSFQTDDAGLKETTLTFKLYDKGA